MGIANGRAELGSSIFGRFFYSFCKPDDVTATVRGGVRQLGDHALESAVTQLGLPTLFVSSCIRVAERCRYGSERLRLGLLLRLLLLQLLLNLLLKLLLLLLHLQYYA